MSGCHCLPCLVGDEILSVKMHRCRQKNKDKESKKACNVHLCYLVGIGALLLIELVTYVLTNTGEFSRVIFDQISFASTISSILLSVIAIIYSIVSGTNGANLYVKTEEVSKRIEETLPRFEEVGVVVEDLKRIPYDMEQRLGEIKIQIQDMKSISGEMYRQLKDVAVSIPSLPDSFVAKLRELRSATQPLSGEGALGEDAQDIHTPEEVFRRYVSVASPMGLLLLLACCYACETRKPMVLTDELFEEGNDWSEYLSGYFTASQALGIVTAQSARNNSWIIQSMYAGFDVKEQVLAVLQAIAKDPECPEFGQEFIEEGIQKIRLYFEVKEDYSRL